MIDLKSIPDALKEGENWQLLDVDPDWLWVARNGDQIVGFLLACNCHGIAMIWRLRMLPSAPTASLLTLLRQFIRDIRRRGLLGYMTMLDLNRLEEQKLARIVARSGGTLLPFNGLYAVGSATCQR